MPTRIDVTCLQSVGHTSSLKRGPHFHEYIQQLSQFGAFSFDLDNSRADERLFARVQYGSQTNLTISEVSICRLYEDRTSMVSRGCIRTNKLTVNPADDRYFDPRKTGFGHLSCNRTRLLWVDGNTPPFRLRRCPRKILPDRRAAFCLHRIVKRRLSFSDSVLSQDSTHGAFQIPCSASTCV